MARQAWILLYVFQRFRWRIVSDFNQSQEDQREFAIKHYTAEDAGNLLLTCPIVQPTINTVMKMKINPRDRVLEIVEEGMLDKDILINAMLNYMSWDDVIGMMWDNFEIDLEDCRRNW